MQLKAGKLLTCFIIFFVIPKNVVFPYIVLQKNELILPPDFENDIFKATKPCSILSEFFLINITSTPYYFTDFWSDIGRRLLMFYKLKHSVSLCTDMVQTYHSPVRVYKYPFELVMAAYEKRFPTCPLIPLLTASEILNKTESADGAICVTERKCKLNVNAPYLLKKLVGVDHVFFIQKNTLNRRERTLTIEVHNVSFASRVFVKERCLYYVHPENPSWTSFEQTACLDVKSFFGFESTVEKIACKHYADSIQQGKEVLEFHVKQLADEGITYIPPFQSVADPSAELPIASISLEENPSNSVRKESDRSWRRNSSKKMQFASLEMSLMNDGKSKLESDYIQRFLGSLSLLEEGRLVELRSSLSNSLKGKIPNDAHLLRFLRASDFEVAKARELVISSMMWRKQHNVDKILSTYDPPSVFDDYFPGQWHHHDLEGRPLYLLCLGQIDIKGLFKTVGEEGFIKYVLNFCEEGLRKIEQATSQFGKPISTWTFLVDLDGLTLKHLWRPAIRTLLKIIEIVQANYPETMGSVLIVRAPRVFAVLWTLISPFINERTAKKFMIYSGNDYVDCLKHYMDEEWIPDFLNGPCRCLVNKAGRPIPKTLYRPELSNVVGHGLEPLYSTGHVYKGYPHEVLIPVVDAGSVLTWDFDVVKGSCNFQLYYTTKLFPVEGPSSCSVSTGFSSLSPSSSTGSSHPLLVDRNLILGVDVFIQANDSCDDGDSVQGTHVCEKKGTYVMQWKSSDSPHISQLPFDFSLPMSNKCKVIYYYELLNADDYKYWNFYFFNRCMQHACLFVCLFRDSVISIESCHSSFSSLNVMKSESQRSLEPAPSSSAGETLIERASSATTAAAANSNGAFVHQPSTTSVTANGKVNFS
ncbi:SEC14-like protein 1 [Trichinella britovi]|uniref:SEC14-like protein 1 n=1 Tax=Trichinella britovi TaxID=45882 RepID=A0A0V1C8K7_TRIBR|nr:SEC14-like protein 1 [Trichinella britovi]